MAEKIVDACCLINVYASERPETILSTFRGDFFVADLVTTEVLEIRRPDEADPARLIPQRIDLGGAITAGLIQVCTLETAEELSEFVRFARLVDDGEAACLAIAKIRGWTVATDDRKAIKVAGSEGIKTISTPELIQAWAQHVPAQDDKIAEVLRNIEQFARFRPRKTSPFFGWWMGLINRTI